MSKVSNTAKRLREALELRNMKQIELCELTGISKSSMSTYLSGKFIPRQDKLYLLSKALKVDPAWLMGFDVSMDSAIETNSNEFDNAHIINSLRKNPDAMDLLRNYYLLDEEKRSLVLNMCKAMNEK